MKYIYIKRPMVAPDTQEVVTKYYLFFFPALAFKVPSFLCFLSLPLACLTLAERIPVSNK